MYVGIFLAALLVNLGHGHQAIEALKYYLFPLNVQNHQSLDFQG